MVRSKSDVTHQLGERGSLSHNLRAFGIHPRWLFGISEASRVLK